MPGQAQLLSAAEAAVEGARSRLRPILMTSLAMIAGMMPMALGLGEGGEQTAPLGRAVIGGLALATVATLLVLPAVFALVQAAPIGAQPRCIPTRSAKVRRVCKPKSEIRSRRGRNPNPHTLRSP